jgi:hypothetical protein
MRILQVVTKAHSIGKTASTQSVSYIQSMNLALCNINIYVAIYTEENLHLINTNIHFQLYMQDEYFANSSLQI